MNLLYLNNSKSVNIYYKLTSNSLLLKNNIIFRKNLSTIKRVDTRSGNISKPNIVSNIFDKFSKILSKEPNFDNQKNNCESKEILNQSKTNVENNIRFNPLGIQMISSSLRHKLFGEYEDKSGNYDNQKINEIIKQLRAHGLNTKEVKGNTLLNDISIEKYLPKLFSNDLIKHFQLLGQKLSENYKRLAFDLIENPLPEPPKQWVLSEGWTRYTLDSNGESVGQKVDFPLENDLVFDVEVCMKDSDGRKPTLATALSSKAWYSWCSQRLINFKNETEDEKQFESKIFVNDLIPMGCASDKERLIVGHNVSFDRSYIKEQYDISCDKTRFLDTLSLHMCVSGLTQHQRALSYSQKIRDNSKEDLNGIDIDNSESAVSHMWKGVGSLNNLVDVYHLYCDDKQIISKDPRNIFISGSISDVLDNFQDLMTYCAKDVSLTQQILKSIFKTFLQRFPHPITFAGMLEMSVMYLPVLPYNWNRYVTECDAIYNDNQRELNLSLRVIANDACSLAKHQQYKNDVWLWDLDWGTQDIKFKKQKQPKTQKKKVKTQPIIENSEDMDISESVAQVLATSSQLYKIQPLMPGYPKWFIEFCSRLKYNFSDESEVTPEDMEWESGPHLISTQMRSVPKLMRLLWKSYPIHFNEKYGWGYLTLDPSVKDCPDRVPGSVDDNKNTIYFPMKRFKKLIESINRNMNSSQINELNSTEFEEIETNLKKDNSKPLKDVITGCLFYQLPHKGGPGKRVGNPLGKDFLKKVEDGSLTSLDSQITNSVLHQCKRLSYWKNASKRIRSQIVVSSDDDSNGAILPRVIVAGTVTRRAVEQTWLTASNAVEDRLGSELKSMIQCPDGYHYVGADVDSQELWIASLIGDSHLSGIHGSTGIGWMTLEGDRANGTDMHSKTAASINITRDEAKVLNYARIYGSGQAFASRFLMQSNPNMNPMEAKEKAKKIFTETKGRKTIKKLDKNENTNESNPDLKSSVREWTDGTESHMFNKLEQIADSEEPRTPVLECRISRALEPRIVRDYYMTSRVNWVVQSSAVDFLHIMLVTMKWLFEEMEISGRFSISIHDELRYIVNTQHRYKAALALQLSNLLTRSLFSQKMGLNDLPLSVAFFSRVDIDKCLRKEVDIDSKTPSNPLGLRVGYGIPFGESLNISELMNKLKDI